MALKKARVFSANHVAYIYTKTITFQHSNENSPKEVLNKKSKVSFPDILSVIAQGPAPGPVPSDEKLDFDDDTLRGKKKAAN